MKTIRKETIDTSQQYWNSATRTAILTFLSSKLAGVNSNNEVHVGKDQDGKFLRDFLVENDKYYNPCTNNFPKNQPDYHKTIAQYRYKYEKDYSRAFVGGSPIGYYKFSTEYIEITKKFALRGNYKRLSLFNIATWLYRKHRFQASEKKSQIREMFINDFGITKEELIELFDDDFSNDVNVFDTTSDLLIEEAIQYTEPFRTTIGKLYGGESAAHVNLKEYVATNPQSIGLPQNALAFVEYKFPTGDQVDIAFELNDKNWAVVEIELEGKLQNLIGVFQVVKYRALQLAVFKSKGIDLNVAGYLVAHSIPAEVRDFAKTLNIEAIEIPASSN